MKKPVTPVYYHPLEEKLNIISHAIGLILSVIALILLIVRAYMFGDIWHLISFSIFGVSLILVYTASTFFHGAKKMKLRYRLNLFDHSAIYVLIAGTYTPFALVTLHGTVGWIIFALIWAMAIIGIIWKFVHLGKHVLWSTIIYISMGWLMIFAIKPLINNLSYEGLFWLFLGAFSYMLGAVFFSINKIKFNHAIFHKFVLFGSFCHFMSIYFYVLPS